MHYTYHTWKRLNHHAAPWKLEPFPHLETAHPCILSHVVARRHEALAGGHGPSTLAVPRRVGPRVLSGFPGAFDIS